MEQNFGLSEKIVLDIIKVFSEYKLPKKLVLFGSRATGNFKKTSDIDLAVLDDSWSDTDINLIKHKLNEFVQTPLKIDVVGFNHISKKILKENILKNGKIIYESRENC